MIRRTYYRPLGLLLLVVQLWMAGAGSACHNHLHPGHSQRAAGWSATTAPAGPTLAAARTDTEALCPACSYLKAVRGAAMAPHVQPTLACGRIALAPYLPRLVTCRPHLRLASRAPPAL